jgi:hypothetical protein
MLRALVTLQPENDTRRLRPMSMNRKKFYREFMMRLIHARARPVWRTSRRKSGANTSTVRHIS